MAILTMSAAVPWMGMLIAIRSPAPRSAAVARRQLGDPAPTPEQGRDVALLSGDFLDVHHVIGDPRVRGEVAS